jgi:hypothetical protein
MLYVQNLLRSLAECLDSEQALGVPSIGMFTLQSGIAIFGFFLGRPSTCSDDEPVNTRKAVLNDRHK